MKTGTILDTDIGYDPDDLFALFLLLKSPEISLDLIVTGDEVCGKRAIFTKNILELYGRSDLKVVQGEDLGNNDFVVDELIENVSYSIDRDFVKFYESGVFMDEKFLLHSTNEEPKIKLSETESKDKKFMQFLNDRIFS